MNKGGTIESGVSFDDDGHLCYSIVTCDNESTIGPGFATLGGSISIEKGSYCEGETVSQSNVKSADLGLGPAGSLSVSTDKSGKLTGFGKAFGGVGAGMGAGQLSCKTRTYCKKLF